MEMIRLTWPEADEVADRMAGKAKTENFKTIYAVHSGGDALALMLKSRTKLPIVYNWYEITEETLVVENIVDTGKTLLFLEEELGFKPCVYAWAVRAGAKFSPEYADREIAGKEPVKFPWETEEDALESYYWSQSRA